MDLHSKKIIGYHFSKQMTTDIIVQALKNAYISQRPKDKVILHTDLGSQYTSQEFKNLTSDLMSFNLLVVRDALTIMLVLNRSMPL